MTVSVIDIGSNSVRLMSFEGETPVYKQIIITKLAQGQGTSMSLSETAKKRTAEAVSFLVKKAKSISKKTYIFATAAIRNSINGKDFAKEIENETGIKVDVISGDLEAKIGAMGALNCADGGIIDVGGGSSEITVIVNGKTVYSKSLPFGAVNLYDICKDDKEKLLAFLSTKRDFFGKIPHAEFTAIGGTATNVASVLQGLKEYDYNKINGYKVGKSNLISLFDKVCSTPEKEREKIIGLQPERAQVFPCGVALLSFLTGIINAEEITVSDDDNLKGYYLYKTRQL